MKKRSRPKNLRMRVTLGSVDDKEDTSEIHSKLEESRRIQALRSRPRGVNAAALAFGEAGAASQQSGPGDTFKISMGGLVELGDMTVETGEETDDICKKISNNFAAETKQRDEDVNMLSYIEGEMSKRLGNREQISTENEPGTAYDSKMRELYSIPDRLRADRKVSSEEMLSNQILSGIPEFELGLDEKFRNIEATEAAVRRLVRSQLRQEEGDSCLVPVNLAANFSQHQLCRQDGEGRASGESSKPRLTILPEAGESAAERKRRSQDKSSDDFHFDKFVKKSKRY